jgi:hypothetical protein
VCVCVRARACVFVRACFFFMGPLCIIPHGKTIGEFDVTQAVPVDLLVNVT